MATKTTKTIAAVALAAVMTTAPAHALIEKLCKDDYSECVERRVPDNQTQQEATRREVRDVWKMTCHGSDGAKFILRSKASARQLDIISTSGVVRHYASLSNVNEGGGFRVKAVGFGTHGGNRELNALFGRETGTLNVTGESPGDFDCGPAW
jgi:hypothetical protein